MKTIHAARALAAWAGACGAAAAIAAPLYRIEPLPANDKVVPTQALAINNDGVVVGASRPLRNDGGLGGYDRPFRYRNGETTRLSLPDYPTLGFAHTVNAQGVAAGVAFGAGRPLRNDGGLGGHDKPLRYRDGEAPRPGLPDSPGSGIARTLDSKGMAAIVSHQSLQWNEQGQREVLARPPACKGNLYVKQLNDLGQMAGGVECRVPQRAVATLTQGGVTVELGTLPGDSKSWAVGINNAGQVVGTSVRAIPGLSRAFRWEAGVMQPLGTLGGGEGSQAEAINAHGVVVGQAQVASGVWRAFVHDGVAMQALPACSDASIRPTAINAPGQVVGVEAEGLGVGVLIAEGRCHRLADLFDASGAGWVVSAAYGINDHGVIVGAGQFNGQDRAFIATPVSAGQ